MRQADMDASMSRLSETSAVGSCNVFRSAATPAKHLEGKSGHMGGSRCA